MKNRYMKLRLLVSIVLVAVISAAFYSCTKETPLSESGSQTPTTFKVGSRALNASDPDDRISKLRIMAFDKSSGNIKSNKLYTDLPDVNPITHTMNTSITHTMNTGIYDFVFIANEPATVSSSLEGIVRMGKLSDIVLAASNFTADDDIPMYSRYDNVAVLPDNAGISVNGDATQSTWAVTLDRLGIKFSVTLTADYVPSGTLTGITFSNLPEGVVLTGGNYAGSWSETNNRTVPGASFEELNDTELTAAGALWGMKVSEATRIILPADIFTPAETKANAVLLTVNFSDDNPRTGVLGYNPQSNDYTLPNNHHYSVSFKLERESTEVYVSAEDWTTVGADGDILNRTLNVSAVKATISATDNPPARIYFNSNQSSVNLDEDGEDPSGSEKKIDTFLQNLASNFIYDSENGTGHVILIPKENAERGKYKIYLNAGGLRREIEVTIQ